MKISIRFLFVAILAVLLLAAIGLTTAWAPDKPVSELAVRWAQPPSRFLVLQGMQVHLRDEGRQDDPEPIVLLHGTSASLHTWEGWTNVLTAPGPDQRRVIRVDLPGFALTGPQPQGDYSIAAYTRFVGGLLDALGVQRCVLAGNSLGGQIAWSTAVALPQRVSRLVLVDASGYALRPVSVPIGFQIARLPGLRVLMTHVLPRSLVEKSVRNVYGQPDRVTPELVDLYVDMTLREGNRVALGQRMDQRESGRTEPLKALQQPTLVMWGGQDRLVTPDNAQAFMRDIPHATLALFEDLGHVPHEEDPARTVAALQRFLAQPVKNP